VHRAAAGIGKPHDSISLDPADCGAIVFIASTNAEAAFPTYFRPRSLERDIAELLTRPAAESHLTRRLPAATVRPTAVLAVPAE